MTYFGFLTAFILLPTFVLGVSTIWRKSKDNSPSQDNSKTAIAIGIHMVLALLYTTPWDNYLVATGVWFYNPNLVSGIVLGFVPVEEYIFFLLQTLFVGWWWQTVAGRMTSVQGFKSSKRFRLVTTVIAVLIWLGSAFAFLGHWLPMTYLAIILFWAIPPMLPQLAFGADILWHQRRLLAWTILPMGLYLSFADSLAIASGTWKIDPLQSTGIFIEKLPLEEAVFFFVTVTMVSFGITLLRTKEGQLRWAEIKKTFKRSAA